MIALIVLLLIFILTVCGYGLVKIYTLPKGVAELEKEVDLASKRDPEENVFMNQWVDLDD